MNYNKNIVKLTVLAFLVIAGFSLFAQKWNTDYLVSPNLYFNGYSAKETPDGGYVMYASGITTDTFGYVVKYDMFGNESWHQELNEETFYIKGNIYPVSDGYIVQMSRSIYKLGINGNPLWEYPGIGLSSVITENEEIIVVGYHPDGQLFTKLDQNGSVLVSNLINETSYNRSLIKRDDGNYTLLSRIYASGDFFLNSKILDENGSEIASKTIPLPTGINSRTMIGLKNGDILLGGKNNDKPILIRLDEDLNEIWNQEYNTQDVSLFGLSETESGELLASGHIHYSNISSRAGYLFKASSTGALIWEREFFNSEFYTTIHSANATSNNGIVMAGTKYEGVLHDRATIYKLDSTGSLYPTYLTGNVFEDLDLDCLMGGGEQGFDKFIVHAQGNESYFATCDVDGSYELGLDVGTYNISLIGPTGYWTVCNNAPVVADQNTPAISLDIGMQYNINCPHLAIEVSTNFIRYCRYNTYRIKYCNYGQPLDEDAVIAFELDPRLEITNTSIPIDSANGNIYYFNGGMLGAFECNSINIGTTHNCDSISIGEVLCCYGHITPDTICTPLDSLWDGASITLSGICENDSVRFTIRNDGLGDMNDQGDFIVIEDALQIDQGSFQLDAGQEINYSYPVNGYLMRMEASQSPGHPGNSNPSINVTGCGSALLFPGILDWFPNDEGDLFSSTECRPVIAACDPNDKQGFPLGYGVESYIVPTQEIEYLIRFQNTGTDTAFWVQIRDTLSEHLDFSTIQFGASSHDYTFNFAPGRAMSFTFSNILLPDSTTNEPESHGFLKYKIKPNADIPLGTEINNQAAIYFDFNDPIYTNTTLHTIGENFIELYSNTENPNNQPFQIEAFPNPFIEKTSIRVNGENLKGTLDLILFDTQGKLLNTLKTDTKVFEIHKKNLAAGMYYFRISQGDLLIGTGKLVIQ